MNGRTEITNSTNGSFTIDRSAESLTKKDWEEIWAAIEKEMEKPTNA